MKYRLYYTGTFSHISSIYSTVYNLSIKCKCGNAHDKKVTLCHTMKPPKHVLKDIGSERGFSTDPHIQEKSVKYASDKPSENKKLNQKMKKEHFNLIVNCRECKEDMKIKIKDMEKKDDVLEKSSPNTRKNRNSKRSKRRNRYKIKWVKVDENNQVIVEEKTDISDEDNSIEMTAKKMNIDLNNLDSKSTSKKHHEAKEDILGAYREPLIKQDNLSKEKTNMNTRKLKTCPIMPFQSNHFVLAILDLRNCELVNDVEIEMNVLADDFLFENINIDEGNWKEGDCEIVDGNVVYEKI